MYSGKEFLKHDQERGCEEQPGKFYKEIESLVTESHNWEGQFPRWSKYHISDDAEERIMS